MDVIGAILFAVLLQTAAADHGNKGHGFALTALPFTVSDFKNLAMSPVTPAELPDYDGTFPGFELDLKYFLVACQVDYAMDYLYYYDLSTGMLRMAENVSLDMIKENMNFSVKHSGMSEEYIKIAVDQFSHNVYTTDPQLGWIVMQPGGRNMDPDNWKVVISDADYPRGVAVDAEAEFLFWSDLGTDGARIHRSGLLGTDAKVIVGVGLNEPNALACDVEDKRLYWADRNELKSSSYDGGSSVRLVARYTYAEFFDLAVIGDYIAATDIEEYYIHFFHKKTGSNDIAKIGSATEAYIGISSYLAQNIPEGRGNCSTYGCEDMCVDAPAGLMCTCRMGSKLDANGKNCTVDTSKHHMGIVLNAVNKLCIISIKIINDHGDYMPDCFYEGPENENITWMDLNMKSREVYFSVKNILYRVKIDGKKNQKTELMEAKMPISGISYDWVNENIYLSTAPNMSDPLQAGKNESIWLYDLASQKSEMLKEVPAGFVRGLVVVPHTGKVFWLSNLTTLEYADMGITDNKDKIITLEESLTAPVHMVHDTKYEQVYILDEGYFGGRHDIIKVQYNGSFADYVPLSNYVMDFAIYKEYFMFVEQAKDKNGTVLRSSSIYSDITSDLGRVPTLGNVTQIKFLDRSGLQKPYPSPCGTTTNNGGCDQICVPMADGGGSSCSCQPGYTLQDDMKTCKSRPVKDKFLIITDRTYNTISQIPLDNVSEMHGIQTPDVGRLGGLVYNPFTEEVVFASTRMDQVWGVFLNGTGQRLIADIGYESYATPDFLCIDPSTRNTYMTGVSFFASSYQDSLIGVLSPNGEFTVVVSEGGNPRGLGLHPLKGIMFWTDHGDEPGIYKADMDGQNLEHLIHEDTTWPNGLVIDFIEDRFYWTDGYLDNIYSADFFGNDRLTVYGDEGSHMMGLALLDDYLYYAAWDSSFITKIHKTDRSIAAQDIGPKSGLGRIHDVYAYDSATTPNEVPVNPACNKDSAGKFGGCSHFCLPTPTGRTCACTWIYDVLADGKTCENAPRCSKYLETAVVEDTDTCLRLDGSVCNFECNKYHSPKPGVTQLTCREVGDENLQWDTAEPCIETVCPETVTNGRINPGCSNSVLKSCNKFDCDPGYEQNPELKYGLTCQESGKWNVSATIPACVLRCPLPVYKMHHVEVNPSCTREPGGSCGIYCYKNYRSNLSSIECGMDGKWKNISSLYEICKEILCPDYDDGAIIERSCSRKVGVTCGGQCERAYIPAAGQPSFSLTCTKEGTWNTKACKAQVCPDFFKGGIIDRNCDRTVGAQCSASCIEGYQRVGSDKTVRCQIGGDWSAAPCEVVPVQQEQQGSSNVGQSVGIGVGVAVIVAILILVIVLFILYRRGKFQFGKSDRLPGPSTSFENPRYADSSVNIEATGNGRGSQANKDFTYTTLDDDQVDLTKESWAKTQQEASRQPQRVENVYDNPMQTTK